MLQFKKGKGKHLFKIMKCSTKQLAQNSSSPCKLSLNIGDFVPNMTIFQLMMHPFWLSFQVDCSSTWSKVITKVITKVTESEGCFLKLCKYQQNNWHAIAIYLVNEASKGDISTNQGQFFSYWCIHFDPLFR